MRGHREPRVPARLKLQKADLDVVLKWVADKEIFASWRNTFEQKDVVLFVKQYRTSLGVLENDKDAAWWEAGIRTATTFPGSKKLQSRCTTRPGVLPDRDITQSVQPHIIAH